MRALSFADAFFFSVQTMSTIGYGTLSPATAYGHAVVTFEAAVSILGVAVVTGFVFAKVSRPKASVLFSDVMVLTRMHGERVLMFRAGNARGNEIADANLQVTVLIDELSDEGHHIRRLRTLPLKRDRSPLFVLTWGVEHVIDSDGPLAGIDWTKPELDVISFVVTLMGHDGTYGQTVYARKLYTPSDIRVGARFVDIVSQLEDGRLMVDYDRFHDVVDEAGEV